ncbi:hypothetical protein LX64_01883 [Chitinophaga skermanii]|uniref:Uncharacterized protein n=1 Tax=Chitinophaga skermanii TaxID=331697 RepID=A0A327QQ65_9BACT|nr:hypothetical protein [Chitinophaga skermanii]RAJ06756.1 hypothetical protein LX64_01883 [Chitinophaga skermanii]
MSKQNPDRSRLSIAGGVCIIIGILAGFAIKKVHIGLLIGLALGLLSGGLYSKRNN